MYIWGHIRQIISAHYVLMDNAIKCHIYQYWAKLIHGNGFANKNTKCSLQEHIEVNMYVHVRGHP